MFFYFSQNIFQSNCQYRDFYLLYSSLWRMEKNVDIFSRRAEDWAYSWVFVLWLYEKGSPQFYSRSLIIFLAWRIYSRKQLMCVFLISQVEAFPSEILPILSKISSISTGAFLSLPLPLRHLSSSPLYDDTTMDPKAPSLSSSITWLSSALKIVLIVLGRVGGCWIGFIGVVVFLVVERIDVFWLVGEIEIIRWVLFFILQGDCWEWVSGWII